VSGGAADVPLRILAWVVAFVVGAYLVRFVAKVTGVVTGDTVIDFLTGSGGWFRYVRLAFIIPVWALFSAGLATLFIEGTRALLRRRAAMEGSRPRRAPPAPRPARPVPPRSRPPSSNGGDARPPQGAVAGQRVRRIPRRDVTS
jgi:hypothetical protein